jgi:hypothetical protein
VAQAPKGRAALSDATRVDTRSFHRSIKSLFDALRFAVLADKLLPLAGKRR